MSAEALVWHDMDIGTDMPRHYCRMVADVTQYAAGPYIGIDTGIQHPAMLSAQLCAEAWRDFF